MAAIRTFHVSGQVATSDMVRAEQRQAVLEGRAPVPLPTYDSFDRRLTLQQPRQPLLGSPLYLGETTYTGSTGAAPDVGPSTDPAASASNVKRTFLIFAGLVVGGLGLMAIWPD